MPLKAKGKNKLQIKTCPHRQRVQKEYLTLFNSKTAPFKSTAHPGLVKNSQNHNSLPSCVPATLTMVHYGHSSGGFSCRSRGTSKPCPLAKGKWDIEKIIHSFSCTAGPGNAALPWNAKGILCPAGEWGMEQQTQIQSPAGFFSQTTAGKAEQHTWCCLAG